MIHVLSSQVIHRPVHEVFDFISAAENDFQWQYGTLASGQVSKGAMTVGTAFQSIGHVLGRRNQSTFEITEYAADEKYGFKSVSGPLESSTLYTFEAERGATAVHVTVQVRGIRSPGINAASLERHLKKQLRENLAMLKKLLEAGQGRRERLAIGSLA